MSCDAERDPDELYWEGMQAFREGRYEDALHIADELLELRNSATFEIRALALDAQGETEAAVECLEEGVATAPGVWLLWELLGNYRSDLERYEDAASAYEEALRCPDVNVGYVRLNQGILLGRRGRPEAGLEALDAVDDPDLSPQVLASRLGLLLELHRHEEVADLSAAALDGDLLEGEPSPVAVSLIYRHSASAAQALGEDPTAIRPLLIASVAWDTDSEHALDALRELEPQYSEETRIWRITANGRDERLPGVGFIIWYDVAAETAYEAYELAREIEDEIGFDHLELDESEEVEARPDLPKGVHARGVRHTYDRDE